MADGGGRVDIGVGVGLGSVSSVDGAEDGSSVVVGFALGGIPANGVVGGGHARLVRGGGPFGVVDQAWGFVFRFSVRSGQSLGRLGGGRKVLGNTLGIGRD